MVRSLLREHSKMTLRIRALPCSTRYYTLAKLASPLEFQSHRYFSAVPRSTTCIHTEEASSRKARPIYVAATRQHIGKTSVSLALLSGLSKRFNKVGFMKPVGQQSAEVYEKDLDKILRVDKDVAVVKQHFSLSHLNYRHMSPVLIPPGYTRDYLDGHISNESQKEKVMSSHRIIANNSNVLLCEGTGHCAVGSIVEASNASVASWIGADMVLVANGGLGSAFDELELNRILCLHHGVNVAGVIINKVRLDKYEQTKHYLSKVLQQTWGVPLLGCVPDRPFLGCPALADLEKLFDTTLIAGEQHRLRHYTMSEVSLVSNSVNDFLNNLRSKPTRTLYVCHVSRSDILLGFIHAFQKRKEIVGNDADTMFESALIICGSHALDDNILDMLEGLDLPILRSPHTTRKTTEMIHDHTPKLNAYDSVRVESTVQHYEPYIDFDLLLERTGNSVNMAQSSVSSEVP